MKSLFVVPNCFSGLSKGFYTKGKKIPNKLREMSFGSVSHPLCAAGVVLSSGPHGVRSGSFLPLCP